jgi:hypothetical protein
MEANNNILAIISVIMISLGFVNGYTLGSIFSSADQINALHKELESEKEEKIKIEAELEELKEDYKYLLDQFESVASIFKRGPLYLRPRLQKLNAPSTPLTRSLNYTSDEETSNGASINTPDVEDYKLE